MSFPKEVVRATKHQKPRYQFYQPGFNASNSCFLEGRWITVSEERWNIEREQHLALYGNLRADARRCYYRNEGTPLDQMSPGQRQAWEYFSGTMTLTCITRTNRTEMCWMELAGGKISPASLEGLRQREWKVPRKIQVGDTVLEPATLGVPEDLLTGDPSAEPLDPWNSIVAENEQHEIDMIRGELEYAKANMSGANPNSEQFWQTQPGFMLQMALTGLILIEENIIRAEHHLLLKGEPMSYHDPVKATQRYVNIRQAARDVLGDQLDDLLRQARGNSNECARTNLDNSKGSLYCYVIPEFHDDGTHDPWGERDVPWNTKD